jgi:serine protease Do
MPKRFYPLLALALIVTAGLWASSSANAQKEKEKDKDKAVYMGEYPATLAFQTLTGEGGYLGVYLEEVTAERMKELGLAEERGAVVMKVVDNSPAHKAGFKENDVIVAFNGRGVDSVKELQRLLSETPADRKVTIEVVRGGNRQTLSAMLSKRNQGFGFLTPGLDEKFFEQNKKSFEDSFKLHEKALKSLPRDFGNYSFVTPGEFSFFQGTRIGISVESLTDQLSEYFGVKEGGGVLVSRVEPDGPAAKAGLKAGDVIVAIDDKKIDNVMSLMTEIRAKTEGALNLRIVRNRVEQIITVRIEARKQPPARRPRAQMSTVSTSTV